MTEKKEQEGKPKEQEVLELKATLFDIDMQIRQKQAQYQQIAQQLQDKVQK